jgi:PPOX class probable F420-dependent enzyme
MPGYGLQAAEQGAGLLSWAWAEEQLVASRNYWLATVWPDGRPHVMPVWGVWDGGGLWFSCSGRSRKTRNLQDEPRCVVTTEDAWQPVVVEGEAELVSERARLERLLERENAKYGTAYGMELLDPGASATFLFRPRWAFALQGDDFTGTPTRWEFRG